MKRPKPPGPRPRIGRKATSKLPLTKPSVSDPLLATDTAVEASSKPGIVSNMETKSESLSALVEGINVDNSFHADSDEKNTSQKLYASGVLATEKVRGDGIGFEIEVAIRDYEAGSLGKTAVEGDEGIACGVSVVGSNVNASPIVKDKVSGKTESFEVENKGLTVFEVILDDDRPSLDGRDSIQKIDSVPRLSKVTPENLEANEGGAFKKGVEEEAKNFTGSPTKENVVTENGPTILAVAGENLERKRKNETDIFIFGFEGNVAEEDVRKAFQEIGEIVELRFVKDKFGKKSKAYALLRFSSAADAQNVLKKYPTVEVCGRQYRTSSVESNTLFLSNLKSKWKSEDVMAAMKEIGIEKIDEVSIVLDPNNLDLNQGAFIELTTHEDAELAYKKIKETVSGELQWVRAIWPETLANPGISEIMSADKASRPFSEKICKNKRKGLSESSTGNNPVGIKSDQSRNKESPVRSGMKRVKHNVFPYAVEQRRDQPLWRQSPIYLHTGPSNFDFPFNQYDTRLRFPVWPEDQFYLDHQGYDIPLHLYPRECYMDHGAYTHRPWSHRPWIHPYAFTDTRAFSRSAEMASFLSYREQGYRSIGPANNFQRQDLRRGFRRHN